MADYPSSLPSKASGKWVEGANLTTSALNGSITTIATSLVIEDATDFPTDKFVIRVDSELMFCSSRSGTTLTVVRDYDNRGAASHVHGSTVSVVLPYSAFDYLFDEVLGLATAFGTGPINGLTAETTPVSGDFFLMYDTSAGALRKVDSDNLPGGGGGGTMSSFTAAGDTGSQTIGDADTLTIAGGVGLVSAASATDIVTLDLDINSLTAEASPTSGDQLVIWDGVTHKKIDWDTLPGAGGAGAPTSASYLVLSADGTLTAERTFTDGVGLRSVDGGAGSTYTVHLDIDGLTADASPDGAADYVAIYDFSGSTHKKVLLNNLPGGGSFTNFIVQDGDTTQVTIADGETLQLVEGTGINADFTDVTGPVYGLTITNTDLGSSQNIFKNVAISGQSTVVADSNNDTLTLVAGTNMTITTDAATDTITFAASGGGGMTNFRLRDGDATEITVDDNDMLQMVEGTGIDINFTDTVGPDYALTVTNTDRGSSQNIFKNVAVSGQTTVAADTNNDTLTLVGGSNVTITTDAATDTITFAATDTNTVTDAFKSIAVSGQTTVVADSTTDTLTLVGGSNVTITTDATTDTITFAATDTNTVTNAFSTIAVSGHSDVLADSTADTLTLVSGSGITITTSAATDTITFAADVDSFKNIAVSGQPTVIAESSIDTLTLVAGTGMAITSDSGTDTITFTSNVDSFKNIAVSGQTTVAADSTTDTLTLVAGTGMTITTDASTDTITLTASSGTSKWTDAGTYIHPATSTDGVSIGTSSAPPAGSKLYVDGDATIGSGTFEGVFTHAVTADRTWNFPDGSGNVLVGNSIASVQRVASTVTTIAGVSSVTITMTWPTSWGTTNYKFWGAVSRTDGAGTGAGIQVRSFSNQTATTVDVFINNDNATSRDVVVYVMGWRD